jgi:hypothetical protein
MSDQHRNRVEQRAYELWEREGRPEGRHDHHWAEAERQIAAEGGDAGAGQAQPAPGDAAAALASHSADAAQPAARSDNAPAQPKPPAAAAPPGRKTAGVR